MLNLWRQRHAVSTLPAAFWHGTLLSQGAEFLPEALHNQGETKIDENATPTGKE
ncbi:hypothetical protein QZH36_13205 [Erwinia sp. BC051422]|uniref:hypothetical protein n=1 Tax=Erwinia wuhanensis TaxID=3045167 RepID=UPI00264B391D|nr:hypothetical protein [Erwinia sp. BC051422]MDN8542378.1 hypothetical protein [Erwinia sp. BC051422]